MAKTLYELLGVSRSAPKSVIEAACLRLGEASRPDKSETPEARTRFAEIEKAYEILLDDQRRAKYDSAIARTRFIGTMQYSLSATWLILSAAWISALLTMASQIGGIFWLFQSRAAHPAIMNVAMAAVSLCIAISLLTRKRIHVVLLATAGVLTLLHLVNAFGMHLLASTNGRVLATNRLLMMPFLFVMNYVPTNSIFTKYLTGNWVLLLLPICAFGAVLASVAMRSPRRETLNNGGSA